MITSLHAALGALLDEGLEAAWARHAECGAALQDGLEKMGLELWAAEGHRLPQLTTVLRPRRRRRRRRPADAAGAVRHRDRRGRRPVGRQGLAHRLHGPHGPAAQRHACSGRPAEILGRERASDAGGSRQSSSATGLAAS